MNLILEARQKAGNVETWMLHVEETLRTQRGEGLGVLARGPGATPDSQRRQRSVFISYSHEDAHWLARLKVHLRPQERSGEVDPWDDTRLLAGSQWREEIRNALRDAKVAILLVSADFLASDFIADDELPPLLATVESQGTKVLPVIVSPCRFWETPSLAKFQAVNSPERPLVMLEKGEQEQVFVKLTNEIASTLHSSP